MSRAPTRAGASGTCRPAWMSPVPTRAGASGTCRPAWMSPVPTRAGGGTVTSRPARTAPLGPLGRRGRIRTTTPTRTTASSPASAAPATVPTTRKTKTTTRKTTAASGGAGGPPGRPRRRRSRWIAPLVALVVILTPLVIGGIYVLHLYMSKYHPADYASGGTGQTIVQVQSGQTATAVGQRLVTLGVVASVRAFELAAEHSTNQRGLEPGFYRMHKQMKATLAFALLLSPAARIQDKITIPEGWRLSQTEAELAARSGIPAGNYKQALANPGSLGLPSYADGNPEGYLWPATYDVQPNMSATIVLQQMVASFNQEAAKIDLKTAAAQAHMTPAQVITVASLLQAEGGRLSDYPKISRVIANRLAVGMPLQFDSTVLYGLGQFGTTVTDRQIHSNTPYNTYLHKGLPPGPIDSPGNAAIEAALHPAAGNWLYFVTEKNGVTNFSSTLAGLGG